MNAILSLWATSTFIVACAQIGSPPLPAWRQEDPGMLGPKIDLKSVDTSNWVVRDSAAAVAKAKGVLGIARSAYPATAELISLLDDDTPFLSQFLLEKPIWQVVIRDWRLELASAQPEARDPYIRTWDVLVTPADGRVVKVRSRWPDEEPPIPPEPRADSATCQIYASGYTVYHGFPERDPRITFVDALDSLHARGEQVLSARQLSARYVVYSDIRYDKPRPVWAITERGVLPVSFVVSMEMVPKYEYRLIVDANTGKFLCGGNTPQPDDVIEEAQGGH